MAHPTGFESLSTAVQASFGWGQSAPLPVVFIIDCIHARASESTLIGDLTYEMSYETKAGEDSLMARKHGVRGPNQLSAVEFRRKLRQPGLHTDGAGLYLRVGKEGLRASWIFIFHLHGRRREIGLGSTVSVSLARAREKAAEVRELVDRDIDPIEARRAKRVIPTFGKVADDWMQAQTPNVKSAKSIARWKRAIGAEGYAKSLRAKRVDAITTDDLLVVLRPIWHTKATTARTVRVYVEAVLDAAKALKLRSGDNPAAWAGNLEPLLGTSRRSAKGHAAIPWRAMPEFMVQLRSKTTLSAQALQFIILTAARTSEVLKATWGEIDLQARTWNVPAERMKMGAAHAVPLSEAAAAILRELRPENPNPAAFVFGGRKPLSNMTAAMLLRRLGRTETVHGTARSSFRDWAGSATHYPRELAEEALAHAVGDATERAYRRETALERRRPMMEDWALFLAGQLAPVGHKEDPAPTQPASTHEQVPTKSLGPVGEPGTGEPIPAAAPKVRRRRQVENPYQATMFGEAPN